MYRHACDLSPYHILNVCPGVQYLSTLKQKLMSLFTWLPCCYFTFRKNFTLMNVASFPMSSKIHHFWTVKKLMLVALLLHIFVVPCCYNVQVSFSGTIFVLNGVKTGEMYGEFKRYTHTHTQDVDRKSLVSVFYGTDWGLMLALL